MNTEIKIDECFSIKDVANFLKIEIHAVYKLLNSGKLKSFKIGSRYRITKTELIKFMAGEIE